MKTPSVSLPRNFLIACAAIALPLNAHASELAAEDFSSYTTPQNLDGAGGGFGWGGNWSVGAPSLGYLNEIRNENQPAAPHLGYPNYISDGGNYANLASGYGGPGFNYIQRRVDIAGTFSAYATTNAGGFGVVGADGTVLWGSFLYHNVANLKLWLQQQTEQFATTQEEFSVSTTGSNSLFLYRIEYGVGNTDTITIWENPNLATWTPGESPTATFSDDFSFSNVIFVAPNSENEGRIDSIRFGTGPGDVLDLDTSSTPYETWAISKGLDPLTDGAPDFDKDNDGADNLEEYAFFTDPKSGNSTPAMNVDADGEDLTLTYLRANQATDVTYVAKGSTDLSSFTTTGVSDAPTGISGPDTTEYRVTIAKGTDPVKFLRVELSLDP